MRRIERTNAFRRDFKREQRGQHRREVEDLLVSAVSFLAQMTSRCPKRTAITGWLANGATFASATSSRICY